MSREEPWGFRNDVSQENENENEFGQYLPMEMHEDPISIEDEDEDEDLLVQREETTYSREDEDNIRFARRNWKTTDESIRRLQSSLKTAFDEMETDLIRAKSEIKELAERNKKLEKALHKAKERENSSKRDLHQTRNKLQQLCTTVAALKEECAAAAPQLAKKRKYVLKVYEVNDCVNCPICLEPWTEYGEHNICSLSCGHFFGRSCITQWISKGGSRGSSTCPVCSSSVTLADIRYHYVSQFYDGDVKIQQDG